MEVGDALMIVSIALVVLLMLLYHGHGSGRCRSKMRDLVESFNKIIVATEISFKEKLIFGDSFIFYMEDLNLKDHE